MNFIEISCQITLNVDDKFIAAKLVSIGLYWREEKQKKRKNALSAHLL